jgi:hypothetical protein
VTLKAKLDIGTSVQYDGQAWTIKGFMGGLIQLQNQKGDLALMDMTTVTSALDYKVLDFQSSPDPTNIVSLTDNVPQEVLRKAEEFLAHLHEMETGYKSGNKALALPNEPRVEYDPAGTTLHKRMKAKSKEIGISCRTLWRSKAAYLQQGIYGLIDGRNIKAGHD